MFWKLAYCIFRKIRKLRIGCAIIAQGTLCAIFAQVRTFGQCAIYAQDFLLNAQYMRKICTRLYLFPQCAIYVQNLRKIVLISLMRNICARFGQDCTYFLNAQYMHKIYTRLYLFPQYAIYVQDLCKITFHSSMCNMYARLYFFLYLTNYPQPHMFQK